MERKPENATEIFLRYLEVWGSREKDTPKLIRNYYHEKITAIGSARHDIFRSIDEMDKQWRKEVNQINSETYEVYWIEEVKLDKTVSIVNCELEWKRRLQRNAQVSILYRFSSVGKKKMANSSCLIGILQHLMVQTNMKSFRDLMAKKL